MSQTKQLLQKSLNTLTYLATGATFYGLILSAKDTQLKENYIKLQQQKDLLLKQANECKIEELQNELNKLKFENLKNNLETQYNKYKEQFELLKIKTDNTDTELENFNKQSEKL